MAKNADVGMTVYECCSVSAAGVDLTFSLPLTYLDMDWVYFHPVPRLMCYHYPFSTHYFVHTIIPNLKKSLSQTLHHYLPLAGNLYHPLDSNPGFPQLRFAPGDSVPITFAVSTFDFTYLTANHSRNADPLHSFAPHLPETRIDPESGFEVIPLLAIQVTLFPETGICIGITHHHVVGDASSTARFIKAWSSITRLGNLPDNHLLPVYDRSVIKDLGGRANLYWNNKRKSKYETTHFTFPTNRFRATFVLRKSEIQKLRNRVSARSDSDPSGSLNLSSFIVASAYAWTCMVKSYVQLGERVDDHEPEYFGMPVDGRNRLDPPVPAAYFGNCLALLGVKSRYGILKGEDGFFAAVDLLADTIAKTVNDKEELWRANDERFRSAGQRRLERLFVVAGSPKFDLYDETDFGWGKMTKYEVASIDLDRAMSLYKSREFEGGLEIGMSLPEKIMDAFAAVFYTQK